MKDYSPTFLLGKLLKLLPPLKNRARYVYLLQFYPAASYRTSASMDPIPAGEAIELLFIGLLDLPPLHVFVFLS
jgi:hypothetical protein